MSTTDEIPQQPHITVPEAAPATEEPITTSAAEQTDQTTNNQAEQTTATTDVTMSEAPVEVNETPAPLQPETAVEKPADKPVEAPISVVVKEDSIKEELSAGKKKKKNKGNLQEKLKLLNDKLNMLNVINKKIESKTGVASSTILLPLTGVPALPGSLALSGTGEDELSDSKKRKTRPNTLYGDYEIDATSRPLKKIGVAVGTSPPMMPQYVVPTTPIPVAPKKVHTPRGRGRPVGRPRGSGQQAAYAQPGTYEPEWDEDYEDYEVDTDFDSFAPKGVGRPPKVKRSPRPQPRPVVPVVPYTPVAATLTPPPGRQRRTGQYLPLSAPLQQCAQIATALMKHPMSPPFNIAVDPLALGIPDYWTIIKEPMDLGSVKSWVDGGAYKDIYEFADDVRLVWRNALTYNAPGSQISVMAQTLADFFEQKFNALINRINNPDAVQSSPVAVEPVHLMPAPQPATVQRVEVDPAVLQRRKEMQETLNDLRGLLRSLDKQVTELKKQTANLPQPPSAKPKARATRASATRPPPKRRPRDLNLKPMSYEEKCKLSDDINTLNSEHWAGVMAVIEEEMPQALKNDAEEVELDIDALDIVTLRRLEAFIAECHGKPAAMSVTQAPTAPAVPSPPMPPREPKVKKPKDDDAKQKPKRQPRKKTGPPQSITEETIRETERQLKAVNQSLTTGNASLKNIGDLESKQQSNKEALTRPKKGSHSSSSSDSSDSSDTDSDLSDEGSGDEGVKKKKKDKHHSTGGKAPMTSKTAEGEGEETAAPKILTPTSPLKKEVVLQNVESWTALDESKPEEGDSNSTGPNNDSLWSEFRTKGQQNKQRMKEREDLEEKQRLEREKKERELKEEEERVKRELREKQEEEERKRMEEMQRRREQERLQREQQSGQAAAGPQSTSESAQSTILQSMTEQSEELHSFEHQLMGHGSDDAKLPLKPVDDEDM